MAALGSGKNGAGSSAESRAGADGLTSPAFLLPLAFVPLWSTGFIFTKLGMPHAEPLTFLTVRFALVVPLMLVLALAMRATWPTRAEAGHSAIVGLMLHGAYLGGVFIAIAHGVPAGIVALIVGIQPILTACVVGPLLGEKVRPIQWMGLALGFIGVSMVLWRKLGLDGSDSVGSLTSYLFAGAALLGITIGTIYQKRFCAGVHPAAAGVYQYAAALLLVALAASFTETWRLDFFATDFLIAIVWLAVILSVVTVWLLMVLIRRGAASRVASLFYLVPPVTALFAWLLFNETLGPLALAGMVIAVAGVALVNR